LALIFIQCWGQMSELESPRSTVNFPSGSAAHSGLPVILMHFWLKGKTFGGM